MNKRSKGFAPPTGRSISRTQSMKEQAAALGLTLAEYLRQRRERIDALRAAMAPRLTGPRD